MVFGISRTPFERAKKTIDQMERGGAGVGSPILPNISFKSVLEDVRSIVEKNVSAKTEYEKKLTAEHYTTLTELDAYTKEHIMISEGRQKGQPINHKIGSLIYETSRMNDSGARFDEQGMQIMKGVREYLGWKARKLLSDLEQEEKLGYLNKKRATEIADEIDGIARAYVILGEIIKRK